MLNEFVLDLIEKSLCGIEFYKTHIMPRSWFHLLPQHEHAIKDYSIQLTNETLKALYCYEDTEGKTAFSPNEVKANLFILISKIATTNQLKDLNQKQFMLNKMKQVFDLESEG